MVRNSARKKAARAYAADNGLPYTAAARHTARPGGTVSALGVHTALMESLAAAGWPVEYETFPEYVEYRGYAGPARLTTGRAYQVSSIGGDDPDPDDAERLDLSLPPRVEMAAPLSPERFEAHDEADGSQSASELAAALARMLASGRARAVAGTAAATAACSVCTDRYPPGHLLAAAGTAELPLCPACAFDGDAIAAGHASAILAGQLDWLENTDLSMPAGWAGPAALLACAAAPGLGGRLEKAWRKAGVFTIPSAAWSDPGQIWVWLPPAPRPAPLDRFGPGARLGAIVAVLDEHLPGLRQAVRDRNAEDWLDSGAADDEPAPDSFLDAVWPAAVAYAVSMTTQAAERPGHRPPLEHLQGSFDGLRDHLPLIASPLDFDDIEATVSTGIGVLTEELWPGASAYGSC